MVKPAFFGLVFLLPLASSFTGVHKLKLNKISHEDPPQLQEAYLLDKYSDLAPPQVPLMGAGGVGRRVNLAAGDTGHSVPLTSKNARFSSPALPLTDAWKTF